MKFLTEPLYDTFHFGREMPEILLDVVVKRNLGELAFQVCILQAENDALKKDLEKLKVQLVEVVNKISEKSDGSK